MRLDSVTSNASSAEGFGNTIAERNSSSSRNSTATQSSIDEDDNRIEMRVGQ